MAKKTEKINPQKKVEQIVIDTMDLLGFDATVKVEVGDQITINIDGSDLGLLIGSHGEHLESLQIFFNIAVNKILGGDWKVVILDIGGWGKEKEEDLRALVSEEVAKLDDENQEVSLPPMTPSQRRTVHVIASEYKGIETSSVGDEPERRVVLRKINDGGAR